MGEAGRRLANAVKDVKDVTEKGFKLAPYKAWLNTYQAQLVVLAAQVAWSEAVAKRPR